MSSCTTWSSDSPEGTEEALRRSIEISKEIINAAPKLIFRRVIIAGAADQPGSLREPQERAYRCFQKALLADARSHIRIGLEINPRDPRLNTLNAEIDSLTKGTDPSKAEGARDSSPTDRARSSDKKEEKTKQRTTP